MATEVTAALIKELRERTGIGMGKCKEALEEAKGNMELAIANLRKAGMASAVKKEGRATNEGMIGASENGSAVALVEVNAETDFVVKNDRFKAFLDSLVEEALATKPTSLEAFMQQKYSKDTSLTIDQYRAIVIQAIGENIQVRRVLVMPKPSNKSLGLYSHLGGKIVTLVEITGSNKEEALAKDIAMHVAAASPEYLSPDAVPAAVLESERDIVKGQIKDKPAHMVDKIAEGKIKAYLDANCLICQPYIRDDSLTVAQLVEKHAKNGNSPLKVTHFLRWNVGQ